MKNAYQKSDKGEKWFGEELLATMSAFEGTTGYATGIAPDLKGCPLTYADVVVYYFFNLFCDNVEGTLAALAL